MPTFKIISVTDDETYCVVTRDDGTSYGQTYKTPMPAPTEAVKQDVAEILEAKAAGKGKSELVKLVGTSLDITEEKQKMAIAVAESPPLIAKDGG